MSAASRLNALVAVELDPVRRHERRLDLRLSAAIILAPSIIVAEALLGGACVPVSRLDPRWARALRLSGEIALDDELALRTAGHGPLPDDVAADREQALRRIERSLKDEYPYLRPPPDAPPPASVVGGDGAEAST